MRESLELVSSLSDFHSFELHNRGKVGEGPIPESLSPLRKCSFLSLTQEKSSGEISLGPSELYPFSLPLHLHPDFYCFSSSPKEGKSGGGERKENPKSASFRFRQRRKEAEGEIEAVGKEEGERRIVGEEEKPLERKGEKVGKEGSLVHEHRNRREGKRKKNDKKGGRKRREGGGTEGKLTT